MTVNLHTAQPFTRPSSSSLLRSPRQADSHLMRRRLRLWGLGWWPRERQKWDQNSGFPCFSAGLPQELTASGEMQGHRVITILAPRLSPYGHSVALTAQPKGSSRTEVQPKQCSLTQGALQMPCCPREVNKAIGSN